MDYQARKQSKKQTLLNSPCPRTQEPTRRRTPNFVRFSPHAYASVLAVLVKPVPPLAVEFQVIRAALDLLDVTLGRHVCDLPLVKHFLP
jgi:hypothetical protein